MRIIDIGLRQVSDNPNLLITYVFNDSQWLVV
jgi:hypothetical protein